MDAAWQVLAAAGADIVLNGHDHDYERFAPLDAHGEAAAAGLREFVVGTGGAQLTPFAALREHSEVRDDQTFGILELNLRADSYDWRFLGIDGAAFEDRGSASCHPRRS
jgi:acid phosphatase type 7